jgi:hypothetical protein
MSSNQKVQSQASASFVIVCKNWRVPNTSDGSWTNRDELQWYSTCSATVHIVTMDIIHIDCLGLWYLTPLSIIFSYIVAVTFIETFYLS